ncbi:bifunctional riboflavin kinase/FAD synthetase [Paracoccus sulfuroxidans]|uniref:bifunctional riboflavin kinase/FAD synthetase n=1 Tax=Paracoccus sulfuroxidans TaxID=384678 RepID=UPI00119D21ED|nr:bifunctional riboflavin kinase/FAD synthetase [Paracoccus sulfuroxidans]
MRIHDDWKAVPADARGATVAIGNFDGVHVGHRSVIDLARQSLNAPLGVITFEPHPREYFFPHAAPFRLMNAEARANRLARLGVDHLYQLPFGPDLVSLTPEAYARDVLVGGLGVRHVTVGSDFCFGRERAGTPDTLQELGAKFGFGVTIAPMVGHEGTRVSSTAIREALSAGHPRDAERMLGHWHRIDGEVLHGFKRGRELGFPTANMSMDRLHLPAFGVYAVLVDVLTGPDRGTYKGVANLGIRPMFDGEKPNLESYLFDYSGDLYGQHLSVALVDYLRPEMNFDGLETLITAINDDVARARAILADR